MIKLQILYRFRISLRHRPIKVQNRAANVPFSHNRSVVRGKRKHVFRDRKTSAECFRHWNVIVVVNNSSLHGNNRGESIVIGKSDFVSKIVAPCAVKRRRREARKKHERGKNRAKRKKHLKSISQNFISFHIHHTIYLPMYKIPLDDLILYQYHHESHHKCHLPPRHLLL